MITEQNGKLVISENGFGHEISLAYWSEGDWVELRLGKKEDAFVASDEGLCARLVLTPQDKDWRYKLEFEAKQATRLQLKLSVSGAAEPFHVIPCNIMGDNNMDWSPQGHFPNLTRKHPDNISCSPYWEFRADRAATPVSALCFKGGIAAVSVNPYSDVEHHATSGREHFVRNGVFSELGENDTHACGITLGYRNMPCSFIYKDIWGVPTEHLLTKGTAEGVIFLRRADDRRAVNDVIESLYPELRSDPRSRNSARETAEAMMNAFLYVNWNTEKENFQNLGCMNYKYPYLWGWRTLAEIGWTGGGVIGYPVLAAGRLFDCELAVERGTYMLDWVAEAYNEKSGLLWDVCGKNEGKKTDYWWNAVHEGTNEHFAYTNGSAAYYLAKSYLFEKEVAGVEHDKWLETLCRQLDTVCEIQLEHGGFGYTYHSLKKGVSDPEGFAGCWFVPALVLAWQVAGKDAYLAAAEKAMPYYHAYVKDLNCWGTPMDTRKSTDQEGNLAFIRAAKELHQATGKAEYLEMLADGAAYEYLWRYAFKARPEFAPLKGSNWDSCGGSVTSVSNPHVHPMGIFVTRELFYLAEEGGNAYHLQRAEDGLKWTLNTASLYPEVMGYGAFGVMSERFCPTDGLTIDKNPDGSPSSTWRSYNGWAAAAALEGVVEALYDGRMD